MWDIFGAIKGVAGAASQLMTRLWGTRTREQDRLEAAYAEELVQKRLALQRHDLVAANEHDAAAKRLRDEIGAKFPG